MWITVVVTICIVLPWFDVLMLSNEVVRLTRELQSLKAKK